LTLAVVRDLREARAPAGAEDLAAFETDVLAGSLNLAGIIPGKLPVISLVITGNGPLPLITVSAQEQSAASLRAGRSQLDVGDRHCTVGQSASKRTRCGYGLRGTTERKVPARSDRWGQYRCPGRSTGRDRYLALIPPGISRMNISAVIKLVTCRNSR
jgi:hypothetical protein